MERDTRVHEVDQAFFAALVAADAEKLETLLVDDFTMVEVVRGGETTRAAVLEAVGAGRVRFESITRGPATVRFYGATAVVVGTTEMSIRAGDRAFAVRSRYTHVFVEQAGALRLAAAQGTPIAP